MIQRLLQLFLLAIIIFILTPCGLAFPNSDFTGYELDALNVPLQGLLIEVNSWQNNADPGTQLTFTCNDIPMMGAIGVDPNIAFWRELTNIPTHNSLLFRIEFYIFASWKIDDTILIHFDEMDGSSQNNIAIVDAGSTFVNLCKLPIDQCGVDSELFQSLNVIGTLAHSSDNLIVNISSQLITPTHDAYYGIRRVNILFSNATISTPSSCTSGFSPSCLCPSGSYQDPQDVNNCLPCDQNCAECYGPSTSECYACNPEGASFVNGECITCDPSCKTCSGPTSSDCVRCPDYSWNQWNGTCTAECDSPAVDQEDLGIIKVCERPCPSDEIYYWNTSCISTCPWPYVYANDSYGQSCDLYCSESEYLYSNNSCLLSCPSPYKPRSIDSVVLICDKPCDSTEYYFSNNETCGSCDPPNEIQTEDGIDYCIIIEPTCSSIKFWNNSCLSECPWPYVSVNNASGQYCNLPCTGSDYIYQNSTCLPSCDAPYKSSILDSVVPMCDKPCDDDEYYFSNNDTCGSCDLPNEIQTEDGIDYCIIYEPPCPSDEIYYWNTSCLTTCPSPYLYTDDIYGQKCNLPCNGSDYIYQNSTCLSSCDAPYKSSIIDSVVAICDKPCDSSEYYFSNSDTCGSCDPPNEIQTEDNIDYCIVYEPPCPSDEIYYWNTSCLTACPSPYLYTDDIYGQKCNLPCNGSDYIYQNNTCLPSCNPPYKSSILDSVVAMCDKPCNNDEYYFSNNNTCSLCDPPNERTTDDGIDYCTVIIPPCTSILYWNTSCLTTCLWPYSYVNNASGQYCNLPCTGSDYIYQNNSCLPSCNTPYIPSVLDSVVHICDKPCDDNEYYFSNNNTCGQQCEDPNEIENKDRIDYCIVPCTSILYWNTSCLSECLSPYSYVNNATGQYCNLPCTGSDYIYQNDSCLPSCNTPYKSSVLDSVVPMCDKPCNDNEYYFRNNNTCGQQCDSPNEKQTEDGIDYCIVVAPPCTSILYWNSSCLMSCPEPYSSVNNASGQFCNLPCNGSDYIYQNKSCLPSCDAPYKPWTLDSAVLVCDKPCNNIQYYFSSNSTCGSCDPPNQIKTQDGIDYCILSSTGNNSSNSSQTLVQSVETETSAIKAGTQALEIASALSAIIAGGNPAVSTLAGVVKMLPYMRYINITYPSRLQSMLDRLNSTFVSFSFGVQMSSEMQNHFVKYPIPPKFEKYGFHSSFLVNYFQTLTALAMLLAVIIVFVILARALKRNKMLSQAFKGLTLVVKWNFFLMVLCTNFDGIVLPTSLQLRTIHINSFQSALSLLFCIGINIIVISIFALAFYIICSIRTSQKEKGSSYAVSEKEKLEDPRKKWKSCQMFFKGSKEDNALSHFFMISYLLRIYLFNMIIAYLFEHPLTQAILIAILSVSIVVYIAGRRPFVSNLVFVQHMNDEIIILIVNICLLCLAVLDAHEIEATSSREALGDVIIYCNIVINMTANVFLFCYLAVGFKGAYEATKTHKKRGILTWITTLLSPYEAGGMDVEVIIEEEKQKHRNSMKEGEESSKANQQVKARKKSLQISIPQAPSSMASGLSPLDSPVKSDINLIGTNSLPNSPANIEGNATSTIELFQVTDSNGTEEGKQKHSNALKEGEERSKTSSQVKTKEKSLQISIPQAPSSMASGLSPLASPIKSEINLIRAISMPMSPANGDDVHSTLELFQITDNNGTEEGKQTHSNALKEGEENFKANPQVKSKKKSLHILTPQLPSSMASGLSPLASPIKSDINLIRAISMPMSPANGDNVHSTLELFQVDNVGDPKDTDA